MSHFLVDTNVVSEFARPQPDAHVTAWLRKTPPNQLFLSVISLGELRLGVENLENGKRRRLLQHWLAEDVPRWFGESLLSVTPAVAERWAYLTVEERRQGRVLSMADGLIAATALEHGLVLVTRNTRDFQRLSLELLNPWQDQA